MRLRALVRRSTGNTRHLIHGSESVDVGSQIAWVEIVREEGGGYLLFSCDANGDCLADTWHETVEKAKAQALFEYELESSEWSSGDPDGSA